MGNLYMNYFFAHLSVDEKGMRNERNLKKGKPCKRKKQCDVKAIEIMKTH